MKHLTFLIDDKKKYKKAKADAKKSLFSSQLIQVFTGLSDTKQIQKQLEKLTKDFPNAILIGTTTAGEITHAKIHDNKTVVSLSLFKNTKIKVHYAKTIDRTSGKELSKSICTKQTKAAIILSEGLKGFDYEAFVQGIKQENPHVIIAGGLAGDNFVLAKTFVFFGTKIYKKGAISVSFSGKKLLAQNRYNLNWTPIGKEFTITSSEGTLVKQIDNEDAVEVFKKYLGKNIVANNANALSDFQLLYKEGKTVVSRTPMAVDGKHLIFAAPLKEGQKVQFGFSNAASVISGSNLLGQKISQDPAEAIYIYSCIARKTLLGKVLEQEFQAFESIAPTAGFFTYGEFYSTSNDNALLNCTTTILVLSESTKRKKKKLQIQDTNQNNLDNITFEALTHFIKQTSDELKINMQLLQEYKDTVDESSLVSKANIDGTITYANDNFCDASKYTRDELIGANHNIIRDPTVSDFIFKKMWTSILNAKVWKGTLSNRAKDGSIYFVDTTIMPIKNEAGKIVEFIAIRQNITKQIESKQRIQEKEKLIKAIFDNQDSIVLLSSKTQGMINANKKLFHYLDYNSFEDFKNQHDCICNLFIEEEGYIYPSKYPNWIDDTADDKSDNERKAKILTKDGVIRTFNVMVKRIDDQYIINLYDITKLEQAIIKAHASEQAKSVFLANMSHEIRTPLNGILGFADVLSQRELDKDSSRYVEIIHKSGQTLLNVVNDILDFSKLETGELSIHEEAGNIFAEMEASVSSFASLAKKKNIDYYIYIDTNIPQALLCDVHRLKQVINNLLSNAIKFTPEKGNVKVEISLLKLQTDTASIRFSVQDSGIGIAQDKLGTVFEAFSQADDSISREFGGTGLGLSISNQYIKMMNSNIKVKSTLNKGSEFYFTLEFPVLNNSLSINTTLNLNNLNISVLTSQSKIDCAINDIVHTYLKAWECDYKEINTLDVLDDTTDIIIISAKLFKETACKAVLNKFEKLQLIYIEGGEEKFLCTHPKFHLLEQPMTGSLLFDKLITLTNKEVTQEDKKVVQSVNNHIGNILIAEDNLTNQMLIEILLKERNLDFTIVNNGKEAVDSALDGEYDLIFMDINMPILDGISATKILREKNYKKPIISLSANVIESDRKSFLEAGVDETLNKPIVPTELDRVLTHYLNAKKALKNYEKVNLNRISKELNIADKVIVLKLVKSFASSLEGILEKLALSNIDKNITHNIAGMAGNLRFYKLAKLSIELEKDIDTWSETIHKEKKIILVDFLKDILNQISLLEK